jgi:ADP-ribose pyrophosphatase YjhB (NUDIX family)
MPDHVRRLREQVGTALLLLPSVSVLARDDDGRVLLVRQADTGTWGLVGGGIEVDERPEDAARREAHEETGLHVELTRLVAALAGPDFRVRYPNGDEAAYVAVIYEARVIGGAERPDGVETTEVAWFAPDDLDEVDLGPFARATFRELGWLAAPPGDQVGDAR